MRIVVVTFVAALAAVTARAGQPEITAAEYMGWDDNEREAYVVGLWDGMMVAETYHKTQELAWLTDCGAQGFSGEDMTEAFDTYLADHRDAAAFGVGHAFVFAMVKHCANAPQHMKDLAG